LGGKKKLAPTEEVFHVRGGKVTDRGGKEFPFMGGEKSFTGGQRGMGRASLRSGEREEDLRENTIRTTKKVEGANYFWL